MNTPVIPTPVTTNRLIAILAGIKKLDSHSLSFSSDDDFLLILNFDSLDSVQLTMRISSEFGFNFGEEIDDIDALGSFGALVRLVEARAQSAAS
jgi:acyl carrier protein